MRLACFFSIESLLKHVNLKGALAHVYYYSLGSFKNTRIIIHRDKMAISYFVTSNSNVFYFSCACAKLFLFHKGEFAVLILKNAVLQMQLVEGLF